jgi:hypothetical protein
MEFDDVSLTEVIEDVAKWWARVKTVINFRI